MNCFVKLFLTLKNILPIFDYSLQKLDLKFLMKTLISRRKREILSTIEESI